MYLSLFSLFCQYQWLCPDPQPVRSFPPACRPPPQLDLLTSDYKGSEDCLYLNVFTPQLDSSEEHRLPVMVWIHGGAFRLGSSTSLQYGPERLLDKDVIVVSINYRLGPLGFLTTGGFLFWLWLLFWF